MRIGLIRTKIAVVGTLTCFVVVPSSAQALTEWASCTADGDTLTTGTTYVSSSGGTRWTVSDHTMNIVGNTRPANNLAARLRDSSNTPVYWTYNKSNAWGNKQYSVGVNKEIPRTSEMNTKAIFDQRLNDPECAAQIQLDGIDQ